MKNIEIKKEVFSLRQMDVTKASYKNSEYYIAGAYDITEYVNKSTSDDVKTKIQQGLDSFFIDHPTPLSLLKYSIAILNDSHSTFNYVIDILMDVFRKSELEARIIADVINKNGSCIVETYDTFEFARSYASFIDLYNEQSNNNLQVRIVEAKEIDMVVLERLINRDHPND